MKYRATRGVCIGVDRHLVAGDPVPPDLSAAEVLFLANIGAIEPAPEPAATAVDPGSAATAPAIAADPKAQAPAKPGKKEI